MPQAQNLELDVRSALPDDAEQIAEIYNHYVTTSVISFEEEEVTASEMANRILAIQSVSLPWLVAIEGERIVGYAFASNWKARAAYKFSA